MEGDAEDGVAAKNDKTDCVCVAKVGDRETMKTGIDDILVDYCHALNCFQEL